MDAGAEGAGIRQGCFGSVLLHLTPKLLCRGRRWDTFFWFTLLPWPQRLPLCIWLLLQRVLAVTLVAFFPLVQLSLWMERWDRAQQQWISLPGEEHVRVLWRMPLERRQHAWDAVGRYEKLDALELGGCPMEDAELSLLMRVVLPVLLDGVRWLFLGRAPRLTDKSLQALAQAGCGAGLTVLDLEGGECFFLS